MRHPPTDIYQHVLLGPSLCVINVGGGSVGVRGNVLKLRNDGTRV